MESNFVPPKYKGNAFTCPHCSVYSSQSWKYPIPGFIQGHIRSLPKAGNFKGIHYEIAISTCYHCNAHAVWFAMLDRETRKYSFYFQLFPRTSIAPPPAVDMPTEIKDDYLEASKIVSDSPRGAAALLRLCIQKLMPILGEKGENLNDDIGSLVKKGLRPEIQMALDSVRVIGNEAVHPGVLDFNDDEDTAPIMFEQINLIVEHVITAKKKAEAAYSKIPQSKRDAIARRDGKEPTEDAK